jgi:hypothetical protein
MGWGAGVDVPTLFDTGSRVLPGVQKSRLQAFAEPTVFEFFFHSMFQK